MWVAVFKDLDSDTVKSASIDQIVNICHSKKKRTLSTFAPKDLADFSTRKEYGRVKEVDNGSKFVYRIHIIALAECKEDLEKMRKEGRLKVLATPKNKQGPFKEPYKNYVLVSERDSATEEKAMQIKSKLVGKSLSQDLLAKKLETQIIDRESVPTENNDGSETRKNPVASDTAAKIKIVPEIPPPNRQENNGGSGSSKNPVASDTAAKIKIVPEIHQQKYLKKSTPFLMSFKDTHNRQMHPFVAFNQDPDQSTSHVKVLDHDDNMTVQDDNCDSELDECPCCPCVKEIRERLARIEDILLNKTGLQNPVRIQSQMTAVDSEQEAEAIEGFVDLGNSRIVKLSKIERLLKTEESLQTKISGILNEMFKAEELKKFFLKRTKKMSEDAQPFPQECITKIQKVINDVNKTIVRKQLLQQNAKKLNSASTQDLKAAMDHIDMMADAQTCDLDEKKYRRALSHIFSNSRTETKPEDVTGQLGGKGGQATKDKSQTGKEDEHVSITESDKDDQDTSLHIDFDST